jgi:hypothetical protein
MTINKRIATCQKSSLEAKEVAPLVTGDDNELEYAESGPLEVRRVRHGRY